MTSQTVSLRQLSLTEAATEVGVGAVTLRRWIAEGRLPEAYRDPRSGYFYIPESGIRRSQDCGWAKRDLVAGGEDGGVAGESVPVSTTGH